MKKAIIFLLSIIVISANAQINTSYLDSIPFSKPKSRIRKYEFNHPVLPWARISSPAEPTKADKGSVGDAAKDIGAFMAVALLGNFFSTATSRETNWMIKGKIVSPNKRLNWNIELYCYGELNEEKVRDEDWEGNKIVTTNVSKRIYWDEGAMGFIIENENTIGQFLVFTRPRWDSLFYNTNKDIFDQPKIQLVSVYEDTRYYDNNYHLNKNIKEYAVVGKFREEEFVLIANGETRNMWFFINNKLVCIFQPDLDELARKKDRIMPYILIDGKVTDNELVDWFRLVLVSKYLSTTIGRQW